MEFKSIVPQEFQERPKVRMDVAFFSVEWIPEKFTGYTQRSWENGFSRNTPTWIERDRDNTKRRLLDALILLAGIKLTKLSFKHMLFFLKKGRMTQRLQLRTQSWESKTREYLLSRPRNLIKDVQSRCTQLDSKCPWNSYSLYLPSSKFLNQNIYSFYPKLVYHCKFVCGGQQCVSLIS